MSSCGKAQLVRDHTDYKCSEIVTLVDIFASMFDDSLWGFHVRHAQSVAVKDFEWIVTCLLHILTCIKNIFKKLISTNKSFFCKCFLKMLLTANPDRRGTVHVSRRWATAAMSVRHRPNAVWCHTFQFTYVLFLLLHNRQSVEMLLKRILPRMRHSFKERLGFFTIWWYFIGYGNNRLISP